MVSKASWTSRAGEARDDDELIAGDVEVDVLEVVLARASDRDAVVHAAGRARLLVTGINWSLRRTAQRPSRRFVAFV
jgi:hypothetical protein